MLPELSQMCAFRSQIVINIFNFGNSTGHVLSERRQTYIETRWREIQRVYRTLLPCFVLVLYRDVITAVLLFSFGSGKKYLKNY